MYWQQQPLLYKAKGYVTLNNFDSVAPLFHTPFFVAVPTDSKWQNMSDLIGAAKAAPNKVNFGSWGIGSPGHLGGEQLELLAPKGIAADVQAKIHADVLKVLVDPDVKARFDTFAFETITWSPDQIRQNAEAKGKIYQELVKRKNISLD